MYSVFKFVQTLLVFKCSCSGAGNTAENKPYFSLDRLHDHISTLNITFSPDNFSVLILERFYCLTSAQSQFDVDLFLSIVAWASKRDEIRHLTAT
jgi:hypothetical protein